MILRSYELQSAEEAEEEAVLEPTINERLGDVRCPTLVIVGDLDIADMQGIAAHVAASIGGARLDDRRGRVPSAEPGAARRGQRAHPRVPGRGSASFPAEREELKRMTGVVVIHKSMSLDGFAAGPAVSLEDPMGKGGERLHEWLFEQSSQADADVAAAMFAEVGAVVLGRRTFEVGRPQWEDTPYPVPCFVLTHHAQPPIAEKSGTFTFVADGAVSAVDRGPSGRRREVGDRDGRRDVAQRCSRQGSWTRSRCNLVPVLLGDGVRLFDDLPGQDRPRAAFPDRDRQRDAPAIPGAEARQEPDEIQSLDPVRHGRPRPHLSRTCGKQSPGSGAAFGFVERVRIGEDHRSQLTVGDGVGDHRRRAR